VSPWQRVQFIVDHDIYMSTIHIALLVVHDNNVQLMRVGGSVKTHCRRIVFYWLDDDGMFRPCLAIFRS